MPDKSWPNVDYPQNPIQVRSQEDMAKQDATMKPKHQAITRSSKENETKKTESRAHEVASKPMVDPGKRGGV
jgi:hypothetical protein